MTLVYQSLYLNKQPLRLWLCCVLCPFPSTTFMEDQLKANLLPKRFNPLSWSGILPKGYSLLAGKTELLVCIKKTQVLSFLNTIYNYYFFTQYIDTLRDESEVHKSELILLKYNPTGSRMITCDANGLVCVWRGITCLSKYQRSGLINLCCFAELNLEPT